MPTPAQRLAGRTLDGGWRVLNLIVRPDTATGGNFSHGYIVESSDGARAYLKALDFHTGFSPDVDPAHTLEAMTQAFNHERELCTRCRQKRLSHVVNIIADGRIIVDPPDPFSVVQYLIFEHAQGDIRSVLDQTARLDLAWALRSLHHVALGLQQLHGIDIAHQDLKPSNVLTFSKKLSKITDLGHAATRTESSPLQSGRIAADPAYAAIEQWYAFQQTDIYRHRLACDMYLFGSLVMFMFVRAGATASIIGELDPSLRPGNWTGTYADVLPHVQKAFGEVLRRFSTELHPDVTEELTETIGQVCEPDPNLRGHPRDRVGHHSQYSLERYVSIFDRLAIKAELALIGQ